MYELVYRVFDWLDRTIRFFFYSPIVCEYVQIFDEIDNVREPIKFACLRPR